MDIIQPKRLLKYLQYTKYILFADTTIYMAELSIQKLIPSQIITRLVSIKQAFTKH
jgi:hypothetical protein